MKIEYWPEYDILSIKLSDAMQEHGHDADDPDIVVHFDAQDRLAEIEVSRASRRIDLGTLRGLDCFEEKKSPNAPAHDLVSVGADEPHRHSENRSPKVK